MADQLKKWTKELDQLSAEVKKFINNIKVCSKSNSVEDDLITKRKSELVDKLDALVSQLKAVQDDDEEEGGGDTKLAAAKSKLLEKVNAQKVKLEGCIPSQTKKQDDMKTKIKDSSKTSKKKESGLKESAETVGDSESKSEKKSGKGEKSKVEKSLTKKDKKATTENSQSNIPTIGDLSDSKVKKDKEKNKSSFKMGSGKKQENKLETDKKETDLNKTLKKTDNEKEKGKELKQTKTEKNAKGNKKNAEKQKNKTVEEIPSKLDSASPLHTETDQATEGLDDVVSDLEDDSFKTDSASFAATQPKPTQQPRPTSILKKWSQSNEKISVNMDKPNESIPVPKCAIATSTASVTHGESFVAIRGWTGEEKDDLSFDPGCKLTVLQKNEDGWWLAQDLSGKTGLVPMNFLKPASDERPLKINNEEAGHKLVQEAFAEVFRIEDAREAEEAKTMQSSEKAKTEKAAENVNDTFVSEGLGARSQPSTAVNAGIKQMSRQDREKLTREAFAEVFRLEDEEDTVPAKQAEVVHFTPKLVEDTENTELVASLYEEDTFTLDDLVEENLSASKDSKQLTQIHSPRRQTEGTPDESETVSVRERVNQWEKKVHSKGDNGRSERKEKGEMDEKTKQKNKEEMQVNKFDEEEEENDDEDEDDDDDREEDEVDEEDGEESKFKDIKDKKNKATKPVEDDNDDEEDYSEFSDNELEDLNEPEDKQEKPVPKEKTDLMKSTAKWLYQSNAKLLKSLEPLPTGVRISTLGSMDWTKYNYQTFLVPQLGSSHLMLIDLVYDPTERRVMRRPARIQRVVQIQKCFNMPTLNEINVSIQERVARICLFDGQKPISNIIRIPMTTTDREKKQWCLMPQNLLRETKPNDLPADLFVRFNHMDVNVQLLIEVGISVTKSSEDTPIELSIGWIVVPLYDEKGAVVTNRTSDFPLQPGTPYEESVFGEESVKEETFRNRMQNMLFGKQPQVTVRVGQPSRDQQNMLEILPDVLIGLCGYLPLMSLYWEMLGNVLFGSTANMVKDSVFLRQVPPSCALFPYVADTPLLIEALRVSWNEALKDLPAAHKKDNEKLHKAYSNHFNRVIYPITCLLNVIPTGPTSTAVFEKKTELVHSLLRQTQTDPLKFYMSTEYKFLAFTSREFTCPIRISG